MSDGDIDTILSYLSSKINKIFCDREFVGCVKEDFNVILQLPDDYCVLFPKLKPFFLKLLRYQALIFDLNVFPFGEGPNQAAIVFKKAILKESIEPAMEVIKTAKRDSNEIKKAKKQSRINRPTQTYYVPPAQRSATKKRGNREHTKSERSPEDKHKNNVKEDVNEEFISETLSHIMEKVFEIVAPSTCQQNISANEFSAKIEDLSVDEKLSDLISATVTNESLPVSENCNESHNLSQQPEILHTNSRETKDVIIISEAPIKQSAISHNKQVTTKNSNNLLHSEPQKDTRMSRLYIPYDDKKTKSDDCEADMEKEMQKALQNINRKRRSIIKNIHDENIQNEVLPKPKILEKEEPTELENVSNWEDLFDDDGDLQPKYFEKIVKHIGCDVKVVKASHDYSAYQNTKCPDLDHVIELYDFPSTFKTQDLIQLYSSVDKEQMYIKWCDDTHALLVLTSFSQAVRALEIDHDIIKSRPLSEGSSVAIATAYNADLKPAMKRPPTSMQTARRLITTHLGTRSSLSKEEAEQERQALRVAREQRRQERQNEKDAWEGRLRSAKSQCSS